MEKILERYERYSYAGNQLNSNDPEPNVSYHSPEKNRIQDIYNCYYFSIKWIHSKQKSNSDPFGFWVSSSVPLYSTCNTISSSFSFSLEKNFLVYNKYLLTTFADLLGKLVSGTCQAQGQGGGFTKKSEVKTWT